MRLAAQSARPPPVPVTARHGRLRSRPGARGCPALHVRARCSPPGSPVHGTTVARCRSIDGGGRGGKAALGLELGDDCFCAPLSMHRAPLFAHARTRATGRHPVHAIDGAPVPVPMPRGRRREAAQVLHARRHNSASCARGREGRPIHIRTDISGRPGPGPERSPMLT